MINGRFRKLDILNPPEPVELVLFKDGIKQGNKIYLPNLKRVVIIKRFKDYHYYIRQFQLYDGFYVLVQSVRMSKREVLSTFYY